MLSRIPIGGGYVWFLTWRRMFFLSFFLSRPFRTLCCITPSPLKREPPNLKSLDQFYQGRVLFYFSLCDLAPLPYLALCDLAPLPYLALCDLAPLPYLALCDLAPLPYLALCDLAPLPWHKGCNL